MIRILAFILCLISTPVFAQVTCLHREGSHFGRTMSWVNFPSVEIAHNVMSELAMTESILEVERVIANRGATTGDARLSHIVLYCVNEEGENVLHVRYDVVPTCERSFLTGSFDCPIAVEATNLME